MAIHSKDLYRYSLYTCCYTSSGGIRVKQFLKKFLAAQCDGPPRHTAESRKKALLKKYAVLDIAC